MSDELNRLLERGLPASVVLGVLNGQLDEEFEVARWQEAKAVDKWCKGRKNIPVTLDAIWDLAPERFYLVLDGEHCNALDPATIAVIEASTQEVCSKLTWISNRDKDPWHREYKSKSCGIAYRWVHGLAVTPPLLVKFEDQLHIKGGTHRYHLARHYGTDRIPFLVRKSEWMDIEKLLPSAVLLTELEHPLARNSQMKLPTSI